MKTISNMLLDNFYHIEQIEKKPNNAWSVIVKLNADHPIYQGHFPEQPVVPGVCMLQIIKESVEQIRENDFMFSQIASCKFLAAVIPSESAILELSIVLKETEEKQIQLLAEGKWSEKEFIKLKALLHNK